MKRLVIIALLVLGAASTVLAASARVAQQVSQDKEKQIDQLPFPVGGIEAIAKVVKYPATARKDSVQGVVHVEATVDEEGNVVKAVALKSVRQDLDKAAIDAVKSVKFKPGMHKGKTVVAIVTIPISFKLK